MRRLILAVALLTLATPVLAGAVPSRLTEAARDQVGVTVTYDPAYVVLERFAFFSTHGNQNSPKTWGEF